MSNSSSAMMTALGAMTLTIACSGGCKSKEERGLRLRQVEPAAFAGRSTAEVEPRAADSTAPTIAHDDTESIEAVDITAASEVPAQEGVANATPPAAPGRGEQLMRPGDMVIVDSVIGQVSGRPIFADALLDPISDQLRIEADRLNAREFQVRARQIINDRLQEVVLNELILAEAEASLSQQQQMGLLAFIRQVQEKTIASGQGSRLVTEERLQEELNMSLQQYTERERNSVLIRYLIDKKVQPRVIVSWKDVQREYKLREAEFQPQASVTLKRIRLSTSSQAEVIEQVKSRFTAGESFDLIAESLGDAVSVLDPLQIGPGGMSDLEISETYKPHLLHLNVGETSNPIELTGRVEWLHVASVDQDPHRTIYDVQRQLSTELMLRREQEERGRYIQSLFERGIHDELEAMSDRLLLVALMRYGK